MRSLGSGFLTVFLVLSSLCLDLLELVELLALVLSLVLVLELL